MARFRGKVGYGVPVETVPGISGVYEDVITERVLQGDIRRDTRNLDSNDKVNGDISVSNTISVVADEYAIINFMHIKYVEWNGVLWTVPTVEVQRPRLILSIGSVYNGPTP